MFNVLSLFTYFFHVILGIGTPQQFPAPLSAEEEQAAFLARLKEEQEELKRLRRALGGGGSV